MRKYITEYTKDIENKKEFTKEEKSDFLEHIKFFQHERLVHLLVLLFVLFVWITLLTLINTSTYFVLPLILVTILAIFYIYHYFFLENSVQHLYELYDKLNKAK